MLRIDSTVTESPIHAASDSTLLWDSVRVLVRLPERAEELAEAITTIDCRNPRRVAKKRTRSICYTRGQNEKAALYRDLTEPARNSLSYVNVASIKLLAVMPFEPMACALWQAQFNHCKPLIPNVSDQTGRHVFQGEKVASMEKIVSIFAEHTDIIVKGNRYIQYRQWPCKGYIPVVARRSLRRQSPGEVRSRRRSNQRKKSALFYPLIQEQVDFPGFLTRHEDILISRPMRGSVSLK